jgi:hypothetical protein
MSDPSLIPPEATALFRSCCGQEQERELLRTTSVHGMSIIVVLLLTAAPYASAQSAFAESAFAQSVPTGDTARGPPGQQKTPRQRTVATSTTAMSGRLILIGYLPWPIATATGIWIGALVSQGMSPDQLFQVSSIAPLARLC